MHPSNSRTGSRHSRNVTASTATGLQLQLTDEDGHTASATHSGEPGSAMPVSEAPINTQVKAAGPTDSLLALPKSTASKAGIKQV